MAKRRSQRLGNRPLMGIRSLSLRVGNALGGKLEFSFPGIRTINPAATVRNPLVLSSEGEKLNRTTLPNRQPPGPPGAARSVENSSSIPTPTTQLIEAVTKERLGEQTPSENLKSRLLNIAAGALEQRRVQLNQIASNAPSLEIEPVQKKEEKEEAKDAPKLDLEPKKEKAAQTYREQAEQLQANDDDEDKEKGGLSSAKESELKTRSSSSESKSSRIDVASGGATDAQKGAPPVNVVA